MNKQLILKASELALAAYNEDIKGAMKIENARTSTTAFILEEDNIQYIIFRGTQQVRDWIFNMTAIPWRQRRERQSLKTSETRRAKYPVRAPNGSPGESRIPRPSQPRAPGRSGHILKNYF